MRSLNFSHSIEKTLKKLDWLLAFKSDFYFVSELKMSNHLRTQAIVSHLNANRLGSYSFVFCSSSCSRGVGIIYSNSLNMVIHNTIKDAEENFLIMDISLNGFRFTLGSVYLPSNISENGLSSLTNSIDTLGNDYKIIGGDFNFTPSDAPIDLNRDTYNHKGCNPKASRFLANWMNNKNLVEPFRLKHPLTREFSYKSGVGTTASKSRIDFFIISVEFLKLLDDVRYQLTPSPAFDHSAVLMDFKRISKQPYRIYIGEAIAGNDECLRISKLALANMVKQYWTGTMNEDSSNTITSLNLLNYQIFNLRKHTCREYDALLNVLLDSRLLDFDHAYHRLDIPSLLNPWQLSISPPFAIELLLNDIKMGVSAYSHLDTKARRREKERLLSKLQAEKVANDYNSKLVDELENALKRLIDNSPGILTRKKAAFECSKTSNIPAISKIINQINPKDIDEIKNEGREFKDEKERNDYISSYFKNIYSTIPNTNGNVISFMSSLNNQALPTTVGDNIFTPLTQDISVEELTEAVNLQKDGASPGLDQVPARLIKTIYPVILPLMLLSFNYVLNGLGDFSPSIKTAKVKLIPKKENCDQIKNWRPISLTNCIYKLYSKILSRRMARILPILLGPHQKAYLQHQIISEASANILEYIENNKDNDTPTYLVALDFSKAFDSVSHNTIIQTLAFFGFPPKFISIIRHWLSNRNACIMLDNKKLSEFFQILVGVPQGDPLSGYLFILVIEILILKLNCFPNIRPEGTLWGGISPLNTEGFADDIINFLQCTSGALETYSSIINTFGQVSNLKINMNKTKLMIIGSHNQNAVNLATTHGFTINTSFTHLGINIDNKLKKLGENWDNKISRMNRLKCLLLSLKPNFTSKIMICKTFLYSQLTYLSPVIKPNEQQCQKIKAIILSFLYPKKNTFSAEKTFSNKDTAGLDLPPIEHFLDSLALNFALRCQKSTQPWALALKKMFVDENTRYAMYNANACGGLNLGRLANLLNTFNVAFFKSYSDIWSSPVFNTPSINDPENGRHFPSPPNIKGTALEQATVGGLYKFKDNRLMTVYEIGVSYGVFISQSCYFKLRGVILYNLPRKEVRPNHRPLPKSMNHFLLKRKSSKSLRRILFNNSNTSHLNQLTSVLNSYIPGLFSMKKQIEKLNTWSLYYLPSSIREFAVFHLNNKTILNDRRCKFQNITSHCSFCSKFPTTYHTEHESFKHFYFECPVSEPIARKYFQNLFKFTFDLKLIITRGAQEAHPVNCVLNIEALLFCYYLYYCRIDKIIPTLNGLLMCVFTYKKSMLRASKSYEKAYSKLSSEQGDRICELNKQWLDWV